MKNGDIRYHFARLNAAEKIIVANTVVFLLVNLMAVLFGTNAANSITAWLELPDDILEFLWKPWTIITYAFLHGGFFHIFWNMLLLYFFGRFFFNLFDSERFHAVYFLGVVAGGALFMLGYNIFPALIDNSTVLIGASAGVTAVLIFICTYLPMQEVRIIFFNVKLWQLGLFVILKDIWTLSTGQNVGGMMAHLGGAMLGYVFARQLLNGTDIGTGFTKLVNAIKDWFKPREKKPFTNVYKNKAKAGTVSKAAYDKAARQKKIDAILDKISKSGYESLSRDEKDFLFNAGKED